MADSTRKTLFQMRISDAERARITSLAERLELKSTQVVRLAVRRLERDIENEQRQPKNTLEVLS